MEQSFEQQTKNRYRELLDRARNQGIYTYTEFHSPHGASLAYFVAGEDEVKLFGGMEYAERTVIRFGDPKELLYEETFPIKLLHICPKNLKFAEDLTHRDYLGAIMNLGIERNQVGDILTVEKDAYAFVLEGIAEYIIENLTKIKHTNVEISMIDSLPTDVKIEVEHEELSVSSVRLDAILAKSLNMSRETAKNLILSEKVIANGKIMKKPEYEPKEKETIIVRGYGRIIFEGRLRENKKGKTVILIGKERTPRI